MVIITKEKVSNREASENVFSFFVMQWKNSHSLLLRSLFSQYEQEQAYQLFMADIHFD